jgi:uroporphyrinogen decarboxylase
MTNSIFIDTLKGIKRERPPVWFMRQAGRVLPSYLELRKKYSFAQMMDIPEVAAEVTLLPVYDLGVDAAILFSDILVIPEAMGMKLTFTDKGPVFDNPLCSGKDNFGKLKNNIQRLDKIYQTIDTILDTKPENIPLIGFCGGPFTTFCYMVQGLSSNHTFSNAVSLIYKDINKSKEILEKITEMSVIYAQNQIKHGVEAFQLFETHAGLIPEELYLEVMMPYVQKVSDEVRKTGTPFIFMPKGLGNGIETLTPKTADFVSIDWQIPILKARKMLNPQIGIQGNIDPRMLVADIKVIEKNLEQYIEFGKNNTNWIFNLGHGLIPEIPFENVKFVVDWVKKTDWKRSI